MLLQRGPIPLKALNVASVNGSLGWASTRTNAERERGIINKEKAWGIHSDITGITGRDKTLQSTTFTFVNHYFKINKKLHAT